MQLKLQKYVLLADFLADFLGEQTEIVLQEISKEHHAKIVHIRNSISGRTVGSPGTDFLLRILQTKKYQTTDYLVHYTSKASNGKLLNSSSFFIKDEEGQLIGMLCINSDQSKLLEIEKSLQQSLDVLKSVIQPKNDLQTAQQVQENLYLTTDSVIEEAIFAILGTYKFPEKPVSKNEKLAIVEILYAKGFFELKDSVTKLAQAFKMSEVSIYKYIQTVKKEH